MSSCVVEREKRTEWRKSEKRSVESEKKGNDDYVDDHRRRAHESDPLDDDDPSRICVPFFSYPVMMMIHDAFSPLILFNCDESM